jgi:hypothetical protein
VVIRGGSGCGVRRRFGVVRGWGRERCAV